MSGLDDAGTYSDRMGSMLSSLGSFEEDDEDLGDDDDLYRRFR